MKVETIKVRAKEWWISIPPKKRTESVAGTLLLSLVLCGGLSTAAYFAVLRGQDQSEGIPQGTATPTVDFGPALTSVFATETQRAADATQFAGMAAATGTQMGNEANATSTAFADLIAARATEVAQAARTPGAGGNGEWQYIDGVWWQCGKVPKDGNFFRTVLALGNPNEWENGPWLYKRNWPTPEPNFRPISGIMEDRTWPGDDVCVNQAHGYMYQPPILSQGSMHKSQNAEFRRQKAASAQTGATR